MRKYWFTKTFFVLALALLFTANTPAAQAQWERAYSGTINKTLRIKMNLTRNGNTVNGSYVYEKVSKPIVLSGSVNGQQFTLKEYDEKGKNTGTFNGRFISEDTIEGSWSNADASKVFPFSLKAGSLTRQPATTANGIDGRYERLDAKGRIEKESGAELNVRQQEDGMILVEGEAALVVNARTGNVRTGGITATAKPQGNQLTLSEGDGGCQMKIVFGKGSLEVTEDNGQCGGLGVSFLGNYKRTGAPKFR